ncbi:hypothetical protein [Haloplanus litoreus]|uniref:DEAD/DEAH box helicase n=1 Tax=Haloplanus litoreus TaxID=767515 RepID=A0ABD6A3F0_9EURY
MFIVMAVPDMVAQAKTSDGPPPISPQDERTTNWEQREPPEDLAPDVDFDHYLDAADVIYFPTGGGKTEAYFGLVVFTAFHDRLRGKQFGMTAFTKFPLRFLSLEQLERITGLLAKAEVIRRDHPVTSEGEEFSVGYFVGKGNTPNALYDDGNNYVELAQTDEDYKEEMLHLEECPFCGEKSIIVDGDPVQGRIVHRCTDPDCDEDVLPVYLTDREVYRFAPTFVVSTIDKISIVGMQRRMRTLFGQAKIRCAKHGYSENRSVLYRAPRSPRKGNAMKTTGPRLNQPTRRRYLSRTSCTCSGRSSVRSTPTTRHCWKHTTTASPRAGRPRSSPQRQRSRSGEPSPSALPAGDDPVPQ